MKEDFQMSLKKVNKSNTVNNLKSIRNIKDDIIIKDIKSRNVLGSFYFEAGDIKQNKKFIKNVESLVRHSKEYNRYIAYLSEDQNLTNDVYMSNISSEDATLEFHHYPFTLYDIVEIVLNKHIIEKDNITSLSMTKEVMQLHYDNKIGLVRLSKTNHQLTHAGKIYIPMDSVFGKVNAFVDEYYKYIFDDQIEKFNQLVNFNDNGNKDAPTIQD